MRLRIVTPLSVVVDEDADSLRAQDASGSFGIRSGHAPFLTALAVSSAGRIPAASQCLVEFDNGVEILAHRD